MKKEMKKEMKEMKKEKKKKKMTSLKLKGNLISQEKHYKRVKQYYDKQMLR